MSLENYFRINDKNTYESRDFKNQMIEFFKMYNTYSSEEKGIISKWYQDHFRSSYYKYFKGKDKFILLLMLKPTMMMKIYNKIKQKYNNPDTRFEHFLEYLSYNEDLINFLHEYSYSYSENLLKKQLNRKPKHIYEFVFNNVPLSNDSLLAKLFPKLYQLKDDMFSIEISNRKRNSGYKYRYRYNSNSSSEYKPKTKKTNNNNKSTNTKKTKNKNNKKNSKKNQNKENSKKVSDYYTKKLNEFKQSYPNNTNFSKCQSVAQDTYRKYKCNFFYNNCPEGWKTESGNVAKCSCNGSTYSYYDNIFDCNPSLGIVTSGSNDESGTCEDPENKEEFAICFNKTYSDVKKLHLKNKEKYDEILRNKDELTKSKLNTEIITNQTRIKTLASELKEKFPNKDYSDYMDFADFIEGYLIDALNFI